MGPQQTAEPTSAPTNTPPIKNCVTEITCPPHMRNTFLPCPKGGCTQDHCCRHMPSTNPPRPPVFPPRPPVLPPMNKPCDPQECEEWTCKDWCKCFKNHPHLVDFFEGPNPSPKEQVIREKCPSDSDECDCADYDE